MILFLTNADSELLCLRTLAEGLPEALGGLRAANPDRLEGPLELADVDLVVVRLLGGRRAWAPFDTLRRAAGTSGVPLVAFGGEAFLDRELAEASSAPLETVVAAFDYLVQGGRNNLEQLLRFLSDHLLGTALGFAPPETVPECGLYRSPSTRSPGRPSVAVVFYRAHLVAGNTRFVDELCDAIEAAGGDATAVYAYSLRTRAGEEGHPALDLLATAPPDVVVTTVLAAGAMAESLQGWDPGALSSLDVPVLQAICATTSAREWRGSRFGLTPVDVAMSVAIPEFDGRIISVPFSFKEEVDDSDQLGTPVSAYRSVGDRLERVAGLAVALGRLRHISLGERRVAIVLSAYPTRRSRLGNAVGLDTPASVLALLDAMASAGYRVDGERGTGDELMAELADGLVYGPEAAPPAAAVGRLGVDDYRAWFAGLPEETRRAVEEHWGPAPGTVSVEGGPQPAFVFSGRAFGNVVVLVQPPRGFGENPVAVYHSPDLPPTHHYLAFYRWLAGFGAQAVVHVGKHGTLEWLPGKGVGLSAGCFPDAALGDLPLVYPFVVNDPGEGTQAKRRTHAVIVDHLVPPLTRADTYDDLAKLEDLLDQHAQLASLDPAKLPTIRSQVWDALVSAEIHRDMGLAAPGASGFEDPAFDDVLVEVDGYLCELKDAQIRGGLHTLGRPPGGAALLDLIAAITRLPQGSVGSLRAEAAAALGLEGNDGWSRRDTDRVEAQCLQWLEGCERHAFDLDAAQADGVPNTPALRWVCERLVPALARTSDEIDAVLAALDGRFIHPGPSGSPSRGAANVLPTGRNFYAIDPRAVPSRLAWDVGRALADAVIERHLAEEGRYPRSVGLVVWGTSAMRTGGDDVAEALALLGVRPRWAEGSGRVEGLELIGAAELGRPRVDVTLRVSGFFRDAFPHVLDLLSEAVRLAAGADDQGAQNPVAEIGPEEPRVFGPRPGAYGSGILALLESGQWATDADLASVYVAWGGWAYGAGGAARPAEEAFARRLAAIEVAVKNQDNREHDIFDSDDYLQDHGGMVAASRALSGRPPLALFGDSANPARPRVRSLAEEAARVVRTRVLNPKWLGAMERHGYKGAFEMAATVDYLFGYDATARVLEDWMYERVTEAYVADASRRKFFAEANPWALRAIAERLLEAAERGLWRPSDRSLAAVRAAILEGEGLEEER